MAQSNLKAPIVVRLPVLLEDLHTGALSIPPFQRDFEWTGDQRLALCGSIRFGLPTGSLMVWRTSHVLAQENPIGPYRLAPSTAKAPEYLLDGRQRMTTLYAALAAGFWTQDGEQPPSVSGLVARDGTPWAIMYDLDKEDFVFDSPTGEQDTYLFPTEGTPPLLPLSVLLDDTAYDEWRAQASLSREQTNRARALRSAFVDYLIPVVPLVTDDISVVTLTFKRVNSGGTPMGDADMTRALAWSVDFDLRDHLEAVREELKPRGWGAVEDDALLKVIAAVSGLDPTDFDPEGLAKRIKSEPLLVRKAGNRVAAACDLLSSYLGIVGPGALPYTQILVSLARAVDATDGDLTAQQEAELGAWAAEVCIDERFGGAPSHMVRAYWRGLTQRLGFHVEPTTTREPRTRKAKECWVFSMAWARSRGTALVLAAQTPRSGTGDVMDDAPRLVSFGTENLGILVAERSENLPSWAAQRLKRKGLSAALRSPANRVICPPEELPRLREAIFSPDCSLEILQSHLIDASAHQALVAEDLTAFFECRRTAIITAEKQWVDDHGGHIEIVREQRGYADD